MANMAWAENAVIVKDNGTQVTFHPRCPYCGNVQQNVTGNTWVGNGVTNAGTENCYKCGKHYSLRFGRS